MLANYQMLEKERQNRHAIQQREAKVRELRRMLKDAASKKELRAPKAQPEDEQWAMYLQVDSGNKVQM